MSASAAPPRTNLLGLAREEFERFMADHGEKPYRARQLMKWIYKQGVADFEAMTDLGKALRAKLAEHAGIRVPEIVTTQVAGDGTRKWMLKVDDAPRGERLIDQGIEMVYIPEVDRGTLCISSQVGCALDCTFCSTGQQGFNRNLSAAEIVGQVWLANRELGFVPGGERIITNVVFMGMGEPLANYRNVLIAARILMDDFGFDLSRRRVTLSTSGLVPQMRRLAEDSNLALAVSLHAPNDRLRDRLVPVNRRYPLRELLAACNRYLEKAPRDFITFEYVMLDGVNDSENEALELVDLLRGHPAKVNLIPFNPFPGTQYRCSAPEVIERFRDLLNRHGVIATTRKTRGRDIDAACGQLVGRVHDRTIVRLGRKLVSVVAEA
jgi:23S rRNA (adenine2503-C2)-methyltransferase